MNLHLGDCLDVLRTLPDCSVDAVVTDPPYGLSFMGKRWDYDVPSVEVWAECLRVLKPGGHLLAFAGTRTQHRMAVRIEDAGFEIRDMIAWVYGSGFPKSGRVSLKPAMEPITVARKPLVGTVAENVQQYGTGALNIDGGRIPVSADDPVNEARYHVAASRIRPGTAGFVTTNKPGDVRTMAPPPGGRWPANLIHDGSDEVLALFPQTVVNQPSQAEVGGSKHVYAGGWSKSPASHYGKNEGSAARFFYCAKASAKDRDEGVAGVAGGMSGRRDGSMGSVTMRKNVHPTVKPTDLMRYLCRLVTPPGGVVMDPFMGSGSTGKAAVLEGFGFIGIERDPEYFAIAEARINAASREPRQETIL